MRTEVRRCECHAGVTEPKSQDSCASRRVRWHVPPEAWTLLLFCNQGWAPLSRIRGIKLLNLVCLLFQRSMMWYDFSKLPKDEGFFAFPKQTTSSAEPRFNAKPRELSLHLLSHTYCKCDKLLWPKCLRFVFCSIASRKGDMAPNPAESLPSRKGD